MLKTNTPFPFLGAGQAEYFEEFNLTIKFQQIVSKKDRQAILAITPRGLKNSKSVFDGSLGVVCLDKYIQQEIQQSYGQKHQRCPAHEYIEHWCTPSAASAFEKDVVRWLISIHKISPIMFVVRPEDTNTKGIKFSHWHKTSVPIVREIVNSWIARPILDDQPVSFGFRLMISNITGYVKFKPEVLINIYRRYSLDRLIEYYFYQNKKTEIVNLFKHHSRSSSDFELMAIGFNRYKTSNKRNLGLMGEMLPYFIINAQFAKSVLSVSMEYNQYIIEALYNKRDFGLIEKLKKMLIKLPEKCQDSAVHHFYNDAEGDYKRKRNWPLAVCFYDIAITILLNNKKVYWDETFYCNALWILQRDNTGLAVNEKLNKKFLKVCLPQVHQNAAIAYNAACIYAEMNRPNLAFAAIKKGIQCGLDEDDLKTIVPEIRRHKIFKSVREQTDVLKFLNDLP